MLRSPRRHEQPCSKESESCQRQNWDITYCSSGSRTGKVRRQGPWLEHPAGPGIFACLRTSVIDASGVVDEIVNGLEKLNNGEAVALKNSIPDEAYYRNFVGLARQISPDGKQVRV